MTVKPKKPTYLVGQTLLFVDGAGRKIQVEIKTITDDRIYLYNGYSAEKDTLRVVASREYGPIPKLYRSEEDYAEATAANVAWNRLKRVVDGLDEPPKGVGSGAIRRAEVILGLTGWEPPMEEPR